MLEKSWGKKSKHAPISWKKYFQINGTVLNQFIDEGFISEKTHESLSIENLDEYISIKGEISCLGNLIIGVSKYLSVIDCDSLYDFYVQTYCYRYNVCLQGYGNIFRYDNQDDGYIAKLNHPDSHHKHVFISPDQEQSNSPIWIGIHNVPTLGEVIAECKNWYYDNFSSLSNPYGFANLGARNGDFPSLEL